MKIAKPEASGGLSQMKADDDQELGRGKQSEKELWGILRMEEPQQAVSEDRIETVRSWPRRRKEAGGRKRSLAPRPPAAETASSPHRAALPQSELGADAGGETAPEPSTAYLPGTCGGLEPAL